MCPPPSPRGSLIPYPEYTCPVIPQLETPTPTIFTLQPRAGLCYIHLDLFARSLSLSLRDEAPKCLGATITTMTRFVVCHLKLGVSDIFQGQFFPYFVLTITALVTVPVTYSLLKPSKSTHNRQPLARTHMLMQPRAREHSEADRIRLHTGTCRPH
jgi:hypothetical protein